MNDNGYTIEPTGTCQRKSPAVSVSYKPKNELPEWSKLGDDATVKEALDELYRKTIDINNTLDFAGAAATLGNSLKAILEAMIAKTCQTDVLISSVEEVQRQVRQCPEAAGETPCLTAPEVETANDSDPEIGQQTLAELATADDEN
jgi:hypothetical protein